MSIPLHNSQITHNLECTLQNITKEHKHKMTQLHRETTIFKKGNRLICDKNKEERITTSVYLSNGSVNFRSLRKGYTIYPIGREEVQGNIIRTKSFDVKLSQLEPKLDQENISGKDQSKPRQTTFPTLIQENRGPISVKRLVELATPKTQTSKYMDTPTRHPESILTLRNMDIDGYEKANGKASRVSPTKREMARNGGKRNNAVMTMSAQIEYENTIQKKTDGIVKNIEDLIHK